MILLFPARKERPLICGGLGLVLEGFTHSCSVPSSLEQEVLQVPWEQRDGWVPVPRGD